MFRGLRSLIVGLLVVVGAIVTTTTASGTEASLSSTAACAKGAMTVTSTPVDDVKGNLEVRRVLHRAGPARCIATYYAVFSPRQSNTVPFRVLLRTSATGGFIRTALKDSTTPTQPTMTQEAFVPSGGRVQACVSSLQRDLTICSNSFEG